MLDTAWRFPTFRADIARLPARRYEREDLCGAPFRLSSVGALEAFYAPLDWVNREARLVLLGAAPGWHEMETAFRTVRDGLAGPEGDLNLLRRARLAARPPLAQRQRFMRLLGASEIPDKCGVEAEALLEADSALLHWTWVARFPVFLRGRNYAGRAPSLLVSPLMRAFVTDALAGELAAIPGALVVPLGSPAADALWLLVQLGMLERERVGPCLPDPSQWTGDQVRRWVSAQASKRWGRPQEKSGAWLTLPPPGSSERS